MWTVDETATNTAVRIPIHEADSKDPDVGKAAAISAIPEIPSSTASTTSENAVTRARAFNTAERTANPPKINRRMSGKNWFSDIPNLRA